MTAKILPVSLFQMDVIRLSKPAPTLQGSITLDGSKSLSNRALIILALAGADPADWLKGLSTSDDTRTLRTLLQNPGEIYNAGDAGTTFRFLTAYLALQPGVQLLTGSARMCERPVGPLVEALQKLGADIEFLNRNGYPPLRIGIPHFANQEMQAVRIDAGVSSQFLSALLLIGPCLPGGLKLIPEGWLVSRPYLDMTIRLMQHFGARVIWQEETIVVQPGAYRPIPLRIEADWSAASYWFAMAALAKRADLKLTGLFQESWQGDSAVVEMMAGLGVHTESNPTPNPTLGGEGGIPSVNLKFRRGQTPLPPEGRVDFSNTPDLAQTLAVIYAGLGISAKFSGLETLSIKETNRIAALSTELAKVGVHFGPEAPGSAVYLLRGKAHWDKPPRFATYGDHRMAMAFAPLAMLGPIEIENPEVVSKSYPAFWEHLAQIGFIIEKISSE